MALSVSASTDRLSSADDATWAPGSTGSIYLKFKPNWSSGDSADYDIYNCGFQNSGTHLFFRLEKFSDNNCYMGFGDSPDYRCVVADTGLFSAGTWMDMLLTWDSAAPGGVASRFYTNNVQRASNASLTLPNWQAQSGDREDFGNVRIQPSGYNISANGALAEFARWNRVLDATERAILQAGFSPLFIPKGLLEYRPFKNESQSLLSLAEGPDVTVNQSGQTYTQHPPVIYPAPPSLFRFQRPPAAVEDADGWMIRAPQPDALVSVW